FFNNTDSFGIQFGSYSLNDMNIADGSIVSYQKFDINTSLVSHSYRNFGIFYCFSEIAHHSFFSSDKLRHFFYNFKTLITENRISGRERSRGSYFKVSGLYKWFDNTIIFFLEVVNRVYNVCDNSHSSLLFSYLLFLFNDFGFLNDVVGKFPF